MKLRSVSGFTCYVRDIESTAKFYETLGFRVDVREPGRLKILLNWYSIEFLAQDKEQKTEFQKEAALEPKGAGIFINVSVDDVDEFYEMLVSKGYTPSSEPRDWPWGNREFVIRDPDGYKLVIFKKK